MVLKEQMIKYTALDAWFKTPQGLRVAKAFASELATVSEFLQGNQLIQLGNCGDNLWLSKLRFRHQWVVAPCKTPSLASIFTSLTSLPLERSSVDCVIAPLALEAFGLDNRLLDEMDRILKPMGYAIFLGINPISFWGAGLRCHWIRCFGDTRSVLTSSLSLKCRMISRGYTQCLLKSFYYIPPVTHKKRIQQLEFFNEMGKMIWPFPAGFYCFIVQKYQTNNPSLLFPQVDEDLLCFSRH